MKIFIDMDVVINHSCEGDLEKYDLLMVNVVEFISNKVLTDRERSFLLTLMEIYRRGDNPFHRSSSKEISSRFRFKGGSQRIWKFKTSLRAKGYINSDLSGFSKELRMLMDTDEINLKLVIDKYGKD